MRVCHWLTAVFIKSTILITRIFQIWKILMQIVTAASISKVGVVSAQAITTSGSASWSLLAHCQIPFPSVQWLQPLHCQPLRQRMFFQQPLRWHKPGCAGNDQRPTINNCIGGNNAYDISLLLITWSRKPGSWCVKPLWSCCHTWEASK